MTSTNILGIRNGNQIIPYGATTKKFAVVKRADPGNIWFFSKVGTSDMWSSDIGSPGTCYAITHSDSNFEVGFGVGSGFSANAVGYALGHWVADAEL